ncbi:protein of unknown function [Dyadobacter sp. SG02]|uniref:DUF4349 domain-containing protein n=1 Tax=Dyadobacter sp. SG02 TaxID=1855291 RepID=UPI0008BD14C5|nr:DUF4349 domain-containing protein [Dyadobacter sp. SG02]SEJ03948.1 protein of unknown function [Dyadobacter sp. SG02]
MKRLISISIMWLAVAGCSGPKSEYESMAYAVDAMPVKQEEHKTSELIAVVKPSPQEGEQTEASEGGIVADKKFIKTGNIEFDTDDPDATRKTIMASVEANRAYVSKDAEERVIDAVSYIIIVHVPANRFDAFLTSVTKGVTNFRQKSISNEDVTAQYVDAESRLKTKKEIENRYRALLVKANTVKDILEIERELGEIRTDIEAAEAQFRQLNGDIKYSTLRIVFFKPIGKSNPYFRELVNAFQEGVGNLRAFTIVLVAVWPFVLLAIGMVIALSYWRKNRKRARKQEAAELS